MYILFYGSRHLFVQLYKILNIFDTVVPRSVPTYIPEVYTTVTRRASVPTYIPEVYTTVTRRASSRNEIVLMPDSSIRQVDFIMTSLFTIIHILRYLYYITV